MQTWPIIVIVVWWIGWGVGAGMYILKQDGEDVTLGDILGVIIMGPILLPVFGMIGVLQSIGSLVVIRRKK